MIRRLVRGFPIGIPLVNILTVPVPGVNRTVATMWFDRITTPHTTIIRICSQPKTGGKGGMTIDEFAVAETDFCVMLHDLGYTVTPPAQKETQE
jgi:hypothetical protein